jgi:hypothetical protein
MTTHINQYRSSQCKTEIRVSTQGNRQDTHEFRCVYSYLWNDQPCCDFKRFGFTPETDEQLQTMTAWLEKHKDFIAKEEGWWSQCDNWRADNNSMWVSDTCTSRRWIAPCDSRMHFLMWSAEHNIPLCGETVEDIAEIPVGYKAIPPTLGKYTMEEQDAVNTIAKAYVEKEFRRVCKEIFREYQIYHPKLFEKQPPPDSEWEIAAGFLCKDRLKGFQNHWGKFLERLWNTSKKYQKLPTDGGHGGADGISDRSAEKTLYESKARFNTMKGKMAFPEIKEKLEHAIKVGYEFKLLILVDKGEVSTTKPLHKGQALTRIQHVEGYDETKHLWVSGDEVFNHLFGKNSDRVKEYVKSLLEGTSPERE